MIDLFDNESGQLIGRITTEQLQFLLNELEEETLEDRDYYIDLATLDWFEENGGEPGLIALLRTALAGRDGMEIRWSEAAE